MGSVGRRERAGCADASGRTWIAVGAVLTACALLIPSAHAGAATPRVVVKPRPGQQITHHPVRLVVRAGPELRDLQARLNGKSIGRDFFVSRRGRRELSASSSHGLRHGRNVLTVVARTHHGTRVRRSKVRFTVAHKRPLAGAGRDLRVARGSRIKLKGKVIEHPDGPSGDRVRWEVVHAPRASRLRHHSSSKRASGKSPGLRSATSLRPSLKPDAVGTYTLKMTAGRGAASTTDRVDLNTVPASPLVELHTRLTDDKSHRPAIQVGNNTYVAPFLSKQGATGSYYGGVDDQGFPDYQALFQVVLFNRTTLEFLENLTFGVCRAEEGSDEFFKTCYMNPDTGKPDFLDLGGYLEAKGSDPTNPVLGIVNSMPAAIQDPQSADFVREEMVKHALDDLSAIGFPDGRDLEDVTASGSIPIETQLNTAPVDSLSLIGNPSLKPGEADFAVIGEAVDPSARGMNGYLTPDQNSPAHYQFVPGARVPFDTRFGTDGNGTDACDATGCTVTATIGEGSTTQTLTHKFEAHLGGYLVAAYDEHTLERQDLDFFITGSSGDHSANAADRASAMAAFLKRWGEAGSLILITSTHTQGPEPSHLADPAINPAVWAELAKQVAAVGGTLNGFNTAAGTADSDYTLVGFGGAGEGGGSEAIGKGARLRGVVVPDSETRYRPANVSDNLGSASDPSGGEPSEFLTRLVLTPPGTKPWPYADDPGVRAAMAYIFSQVPALASGRTAYWANDIDPGHQQTLVNEVQLPTEQVTPSGQKPLGDLFTPGEFRTARGQISDELGYVSNVRTYLGHLAAPSGAASNDAWDDAKTLADNLNSTLKALKAQAERNLQIVELFAGFLDLASLPFGGEEGEVIEKLVYSVSAGLEFANDAIQTAQDGSSPGDADVAVDDVGTQLRNRLQDVSDSFDSIGDIIVSDWRKLQLIGKYGGCDLPGGGCVCKLKGGCPPNLDQLAYPSSDKKTEPAVTKIALQRMAYEKILPYYFPIIDMGLTHSCSHPPPCSPDTGPEPRWTHQDSPSFVAYICNGTFPSIGESTPFGDYPDGTQADEAYASSLDRLDPAGGGNMWRVFLAAAPVDELWGWPDPAILHRMFAPVDVDDLSADPPIGLGISPVDWMREANTDHPGGPPFGCGFLSAP